MSAQIVQSISPSSVDRRAPSTNQSILIHTTAATHWDHCDWDDMDHGHHVNVHVYRSRGTWVASTIQNSNHHAGDEPHHDGAHHD